MTQAMTQTGGVVTVQGQTMMADNTLPPAPRSSAGPAPLRPPGSARRTSSIDVTWPDGRWHDMTLVGRARDVVTPRSGGSPIVIAEDGFHARLKSDRTILAITTEPERPTADALVGARGGGHLRKAIDEAMPEERRAASPLHLILDDISGASLVAGWAWSQWIDDWLGEMSKRMDEGQLARALRNMEGICTGFAPGSSALALGPTRGSSNGAPAPDLRNQDDPDGWHRFPVEDGVNMRRARRIDVTLGDAVTIDAAFQDSASRPDGGRMVLHEYRLAATADPTSLLITSITAEPRVLPFRECPSATRNLTRLLGAPLVELRDRVLEELRGTAGCTHLNDALRALSAVPSLLEHLHGREDLPVAEH
jgi:Protein of unknown function (DUF2889)